jgi:hypothetical protein
MLTAVVLHSFASSGKIDLSDHSVTCGKRILASVKYSSALRANVNDRRAAEHTCVGVLTSALGKECGAVKLNVKISVDLGAIDHGCLEAREQTVGLIQFFGSV